MFDSILNTLLIITLQSTSWKVSVLEIFLVRMRENTDQKNFEYEHFSCSI